MINTKLLYDRAQYLVRTYQLQKEHVLFIIGRNVSPGSRRTQLHSRSQMQGTLSILIETQNQVNRNVKKHKMQSVCLYAITITSKLGILSSSAKCNANIHRTQISSSDNKEIYIH